MSLFLRVSGIVLILFVFLGAGVVIGEKHGASRNMVAIQPVTSYRFQPIADGKALDTKTGRVCFPIALPAGATLDDGTPSCPTLDSR
jgi:hypothetical protein